MKGLPARKRRGVYMSKVEDWMDDDNFVPEQCDDCTRPNGCIRGCVVQQYINEDVSAIRGEKQ